METFQGLSPPKVEKAARETKGMFQTLIGASLGPVGALLSFLEKLKPFMALISIIQGLFSALMGEAMKPLIDTLKPLFDILIGFMPIFTALGKIIGVLISIGLTPLIAVFKLVEKFLTPLIPYIETFANLMGGLMKYIDPLVDIIMNGLVVGIKAIWWGIASFINGIISLINLIPGISLKKLPLPTFQYGGIMPYTGPAWLEEGEKVSTAYENREMIDLLQEISNSNRRILMDKEFRHR